jgi:translation elongation factor EF-Tu-like GTPase
VGRYVSIRNKKMHEFKFKSNDMFVLFRRGVVFRGLVETGTGSVGDRVSFETKDGTLKATITAIEHNRSLIEKTILRKEIGLLLEQFDLPLANEMVNYTEDETKNLPSPQELLNIEYPVYICATN